MLFKSIDKLTNVVQYVSGRNIRWASFYTTHCIYGVYLDLATKFEWESRMEIDPINLWKLSSATFVLFEVYSFQKEKSC
jgi:hypothetical protein